MTKGFLQSQPLPPWPAWTQSGYLQITEFRWVPDSERHQRQHSPPLLPSSSPRAASGTFLMKVFSTQMGLQQRHYTEGAFSSRVMSSHTWTDIQHISTQFLRYWKIPSLSVLNLGLPRWCTGKESACQCRRHRRCKIQLQGREDPLEEGMVTHSSILAWKIPWTKEPCRLQPMGPQSQTQESNWDKCPKLKKARASDNASRWGNRLQRRDRERKKKKKKEICLEQAAKQHQQQKIPLLSMR